jgi:hypothetical protein
MYPNPNAQSSAHFVTQKKLKDLEMIPNPGPATDGFNTWWQKTEAQNMAMISEASDLMNAHQRISVARQPCTRQAH